jgi:hypothetical protein
MITPNDTLVEQLASHGFNKKKLKEYRVPAIFKDYWPEIELAPFCDKAESKGIILFEVAQQLYAAKYELKKIKPGLSGTSKPIICDFCFTVQPRNQTALITFDLNREKTKSVAYFCCADLQCSLHVRGLTDAALRSKSQLREDISPEARITRFIDKTQSIFSTNRSVLVSG